MIFWHKKCDNVWYLATTKATVERMFPMIYPRLRNRSLRRH